MTSTDTLMAVKVAILVAAGAGFVWWQLRDVAQEQRRTKERDKQASPPKPTGEAD